MNAQPIPLSHALKPHTQPWGSVDALDTEAVLIICAAVVTQARKDAEHGDLGALRWLADVAMARPRCLRFDDTEGQ